MCSSDSFQTHIKKSDLDTNGKSSITGLAPRAREIQEGGIMQFDFRRVGSHSKGTVLDIGNLSGMLSGALN